MTSFCSLSPVSKNNVRYNFLVFDLRQKLFPSAVWGATRRTEKTAFLLRRIGRRNNGSKGGTQRRRGYADIHLICCLVSVPQGGASHSAIWTACCCDQRRWRRQSQRAAPQATRSRSFRSWTRRRPGSMCRLSREPCSRTCCRSSAHRGCFSQERCNRQRFLRRNSEKFLLA